MKYQGCEGCCGHGVYSSGGTCEWCGGRGDRNGSFSLSVDVEGKTFTTTLWDVDGEYRYSPSTTGFARTLLVEVVGECWRWALEPEWSGWRPFEGQDAVVETAPSAPTQKLIFSCLPEGVVKPLPEDMSPARRAARKALMERLGKIFSLGRE